MIPLDEKSHIEWTDDTGQVQRLYPDAMTAEQCTLSAQVTTYPIDSGAKVTDHYIVDPAGLHVEMSFSGSPTRGDLIPGNAGTIRTVDLYIPEGPTPTGLGGAVSALKGALGFGPPAVPDQADVLQFGSNPERLGAVVALLGELRASGTLLSVATTMGVLENMAIVNAQASRPEASDEGRISLDLQQLTFVQSDVAVAVPLPLEPRGKKKSNSSAGSTTDPSSVTGPGKTAARAALDAAKDKAAAWFGGP